MSLSVGKILVCHSGRRTSAEEHCAGSRLYVRVLFTGWQVLDHLGRPQ